LKRFGGGTCTCAIRVAARKHRVGHGVERGGTTRRLTAREIGDLYAAVGL